jgi:hypothetical protein
LMFLFALLHVAHFVDCQDYSIYLQIVIWEVWFALICECKILCNAMTSLMYMCYQPVYSCITPAGELNF